MTFIPASPALLIDITMHVVVVVVVVSFHSLTNYAKLFSG